MTESESEDKPHSNLYDIVIHLLQEKGDRIMFLCHKEILQISTYPISFILGFLAFLVDAYQEKERSDSSGNVSLCTVLHLHPQLAPVKVAVLSQSPEQNELCEVAQQLSSELREAGECTCMSG